MVLERQGLRDMRSGGNQWQSAHVRALGNQRSRISAGRCAHVRCNTFDWTYAR